MKIVVKDEVKEIEVKDELPTIYEVLYGQSLSQIGLDIYKSPTYWPLIFSANSSKIKDPDKIFLSSKLTIPAKSEGKVLHDSYLDVYDAYMSVDKMSRSFWILCEGANYIGEDFQRFLMKKLHPMEYKIIQRCLKSK